MSTDVLKAVTDDLVEHRRKRHDEVHDTHPSLLLRLGISNPQLTEQHPYHQAAEPCRSITDLMYSFFPPQLLGSKITTANFSIGM